MGERKHLLPNSGVVFDPSFSTARAPREPSCIIQFSESQVAETLQVSPASPKPNEKLRQLSSRKTKTKQEKEVPLVLAAGTRWRSLENLSEAST